MQRPRLWLYFHTSFVLVVGDNHNIDRLRRSHTYDHLWKVVCLLFHDYWNSGCLSTHIHHRVSVYYFVPQKRVPEEQLRLWLGVAGGGWRWLIISYLSHPEIFIRKPIQKPIRSFKNLWIDTKFRSGGILGKLILGSGKNNTKKFLEIIHS